MAKPTQQYAFAGVRLRGTQILVDDLSTGDTFELALNPQEKFEEVINGLSSWDAFTVGMDYEKKLRKQTSAAVGEDIPK